MWPMNGDATTTATEYMEKMYPVTLAETPRLANSTGKNGATIE